ncbi:TPA: ead/Ea22-like family protein [Klebsiella pneumoniae subsp. pneumoniae]|uniref:ead/Ea22-like family protein n=1 Tax=Klebsiella pneumoniae TaxID=573 RepID=UPI0021F73843|nr:ead/Ea22-like family protein [Klebsiella pneumoniae]HDS2522685.1 ead/Ea22-like family protein [Klebsiella pneumoniae subsp. pneumoniae]MCW0270130.1 ead/Ea22-like family protein [Klebsiella pneumoniae]HCI5917223.1 ead/Ea22-like family protein [Klebsiella pneumoniae]HDT3813557.1 ead/Ea22-like family protein [Klebsiella pneumoniae subsp. pneumoniae]HDZ9426401.1 ead/Ea22-like family protein [Klebsiella pneumoniae]
MTDITELAQRMRTAAKKATPGQWVAFTHADSRTFSVHTPDDNRCGDVIKWAGFDGQRKAKANAEFIALANPANVLALVEALEKAQQRIAELENNEIQEEGNQFLVVRHPGKVPVIKHPVGELEDYLRQIFKADPLATIDIVTHRYYGVGGQFVEDADEYLHEMSIKVEAE